MFLIFNTGEQQNKEKQSLAARGAGLLKRGRRKSDTQELDYEAIAARQAEMKAAAEQAEAREEAKRLAAARDADRAAETYDVKGHTTTGNPRAADPVHAPVSIDTQVLAAQTDARAMEEFIAAQRPFIRASAARAAGRFITESDDEYMTAMEAFHEAVLKYEPRRGNFPAFAGVVIKRRILDQYRRAQKFSPELAVDGSLMDGGADPAEEVTADPTVRSVQQQVAMDEPNRKKEALRLEIAALQQILQKYGFGFMEMKESAPKSIKTREVCREVVCFLLEEDQMIAVRRDRHLPMQIISDSLHISSKKIERHRKYILAVCEILDGDFPYLSEFLGETRAMLRGE